MLIPRFGAFWCEISGTVGVMTRVDASSLEVLSTLLAFCWKKIWGGGGKRQWTIVFQNNKLLALLFFPLFFENFRGAKVVWGVPPVTESQFWF